MRTVPVAAEGAKLFATAQPGLALASPQVAAATDRRRSGSVAQYAVDDVDGAVGVVRHALVVGDDDGGDPP